MATEADLIQKFKDLNIPVGADFEELIHAAFAGSNLADLVNNYDSRIATVETDLTTKADESKVVHDNHDGTININGHSFTPAVLDSEAGKNAQPIETDVDTLVKPGLYYVSGSAPNNPFKALMMLETKIQYDWKAFREVQISYELENKSGIAVRSVSPKGSLTELYTASPWVFLSDDSKVVHKTGDEEISGKKTFDTAPIDKATGTPYSTKSDVTTAISAATANMADDSKVAHLSGINNFTGSIQHNGNSVGAHIQASNNDEDSAINDSTNGNPDDIYYWFEN